MIRKEVMPMPRKDSLKVDLSQLYKPHPRQILAHTTPEGYILYGG